MGAFHFHHPSSQVHRLHYQAAHRPWNERDHSTTLKLPKLSCGGYLAYLLVKWMVVPLIASFTRLMSFRSIISLSCIPLVCASRHPWQADRSIDLNSLVF